MFIMVDLDKTFFKVDINWFLFKHVFWTDFFFSLKVFFTYVFNGETQAKQLLSPYLDLFNLDLFVNKKVLDFLELQKDSKIILATGSNELIAEKVVEKFKIFSDYIASTENFNCVGKNKLEKILVYTDNEPFFYIGDSFVDIPIWESADKIGVVNPSEKLIEKVKKIGKEYVCFYN